MTADGQPVAGGGRDQGAPAGPRIAAVSAVVCNFNGETYLAACLDALLAMGEELDEILVVDNGSTDRSIEILERDYPSVDVLALGVNGGPGTARNAGMRAARNRWVLAVDNDAVLEPDVLAKLRAALEADHAAVLAQPRSLVHSDPSTVHYDGASFHYVGLFTLRNFWRPLAQAEGHGTVPVDGLVSICALIDRDIALDQGGYDEDFFILFEDFDLSLRLRIAGHRILSVEDAIVLHNAGTPGISFRNEQYPRRRAFYHSRNRWILLIKNHGWWTLLLSSPGILVYELAWLVFVLRSGHLGVHLRGKWVFVRDLPTTLRKRRRIQSGRRTRDRDLLVGGPLTLSPQLVAKPVAARLAGLLDGVLRLWWALVQPLVR
ncbi:glycosyltransferase family 2 protein [Engelhardtia mirabilis]|uniref:N-acetylglucosaminyl-diphospho-decaprenol L-rhamnosyltransferase n=1 Tax=Engelhardtia mirabilis TaxID=2528011 RepID=A0A518BIA9_9BACT|nr:N-acetylglucosaminyl-diphospho-decaprenol L-rhamnosyltransferase [Planctomycetes bacterium Pla133]QDV01020.1 N-acetylglucosaminyl-diphospho-decaprenol L-rhamnosyltransferase [Planctomycetes bacterium Pla86]